MLDALEVPPETETATPARRTPDAVTTTENVVVSPDAPQICQPGALVWSAVAETIPIRRVPTSTDRELVDAAAEPSVAVTVAV